MRKRPKELFNEGERDLYWNLCENIMKQCEGIWFMTAK